MDQLNQVSVLIVVDVEGALTSGLPSNLYMVDTTGYLGRVGQGTDELQTNCSDGQVINWSVVPVDPNTNITITGFTGQMVNDRVCNPRLIDAPDGPYWSGRVEAQGQPGRQQYSVALAANNTALPPFDPFLQISA